MYILLKYTYLLSKRAFFALFSGNPMSHSFFNAAASISCSVCVGSFSISEDKN